MPNYKIFHNRYLVFSIIVIFVNTTFYGCYSLRETILENDKQIKLYKIETVDGNVIDFQDNKPGYALFLNNTIIRTKPNGEKEIIPISDVKKYYTEKFDFGKTFALVVGGSALVLVLVIGIGLLTLRARGYGD